MYLNIKQNNYETHKKWHIANRMPTNATLEERIAWHVGHKKNCSC